jgi:hypothetical protein
MDIKPFSFVSTLLLPAKQEREGFVISVAIGGEGRGRGVITLSY